MGGLAWWWVGDWLAGGGWLAGAVKNKAQFPTKLKLKLKLGLAILNKLQNQEKCHIRKKEDSE